MLNSEFESKIKNNDFNYEKNLVFAFAKCSKIRKLNTFFSIINKLLKFIAKAFKKANFESILLKHFRQNN